MHANAVVSRFSAFASVLLLLFVPTVSGLIDTSLPEIFYPFGTDQHDLVVPPNDDGYSDPIRIHVGFPFFNTVRRTIYVNTNGGVSFDSGVSTFTPSPFPINSSNIVAVYWADVDTRINDGRVYYRETTDNELLSRASLDIQSAFSAQGFFYFKASWVFMATWHNVTYYGGNQTSPTQTFQMILVTDGRHSFALFHYGTLRWTTGTASGGDASTGLGGTAAQVGFNAGDAVNYYAVPFSRTSNIVDIWKLSNVGRTGRWAFRIDSASIESAGCLPIESDAAPEFGCPILSGPTVINRLWFEFYCTVPTNVTDPSARFNATFLIDGATHDDIPVWTLNATDNRATLHERHLYGKLGKWLSCKVHSYWIDRPSNRSQAAISSTSYNLAIRASESLVSISESDPSPAKLMLISTLPITCQSVDASGQPEMCQIVLRVSCADGIAVRQRHPALATPRSCSYLITETDWKPSEELAYNRAGPLEIKATIDPFSTDTRLSSIGFAVVNMTAKTINGETYDNLWNGYSVAVNVYRYDSRGTQVSCSSSGDPRIGTFDSLYYSTFSTGEFIYVRSTRGLPFEVHVRHWPCARSVVSCVCGVAVREDDVILVADMCKDGVMHYVTFDNNTLPNGAGITTSSGGYSFKIQMPTGNKVVANTYQWGLNIEIYISSNMQTEGLCGNNDRNPANDLKVRGSNRTMSVLSNGQAPNEVVDSWRVYIGTSLFDAYLADLPRDDPAAETPATYCAACATNDVPTCGGPAVFDRETSSAWEPNIVVRARVPLGMSRARRRREVAGSRPITDDIDFIYGGLRFTENRTTQLSLSWPTSTGISEQQARESCRQRIFDVNVVGQTCSDSLPIGNVSAIIQKCVDDVQVSGDFSWTADKIPEVQRMCIDVVMSRNYTGINDTAIIRRAVLADVQSVTSYSCEPVDCNGHGFCSNGTCVCSGDFTGADCAISRSAIPSIVRLLDPTVCDIRTRLCQSVAMVTANRSTTVTCRVVVTKTDGSSETHSTSAQVTSTNSVTCSLPLQPLSLFSNSFNFTAEHGPGYNFYSLPLGGAVLRYAMSISNDGQRYSIAQPMKVVDTLCMDCSQDVCVQKSATCLINGYCFANGDVNAYESGCVCHPEKSSTAWTTDGTCKAAQQKDSSSRRLSSAFWVVVLLLVVTYLQLRF